MILVYGLTGLAFAFVVLWFAWPDFCYTGAGEEPDDLPALGDSIDRAIALAAALPEETLAYIANERVYLTPQGAAVAAAL